MGKVGNRLPLFHWYMFHCKIFWRSKCISPKRNVKQEATSSRTWQEENHAPTLWPYLSFHGLSSHSQILEHTSENPMSRLISQVLATLLGLAELPSLSQSLTLIVEELPRGPHSPEKAATLANDTWETVLGETIKFMQKYMIKYPKHLSQTCLPVADKQKYPQESGCSVPRPLPDVFLSSVLGIFLCLPGVDCSLPLSKKDADTCYLREDGSAKGQPIPVQSWCTVRWVFALRAAHPHSHAWAAQKFLHGLLVIARGRTIFLKFCLLHNIAKFVFDSLSHRCCFFFLSLLSLHSPSASSDMLCVHGLSPLSSLNLNHRKEWVI